MNKRYEHNQQSAFLSVNDADAMLYDDVPLSNQTTRYPSRLLNLMAVKPDKLQPRRAIPYEVRGDWVDDPHFIQRVLRNWHQRAQALSDSPIDLSLLIAGGGEGREVAPNNEHPIVSKFLALVSLAASIHQQGLTNPITVYQAANAYVIIDGERRYLAHHLIRLAGFSADKINATIQPSANVLVQASENNAREGLNAIGMARQIARLYMLLNPDADLQSYDELVSEGGSDRGFYAQVYDLDLRIPRGKSQEVLDATGLGSLTQVNQYKKLLRLPDRFWIEADEKNYDEGKLRHFFTLPGVNSAQTIPDDLHYEEYVEYAKQTAPKANKNVDTLTTVNVSQGKNSSSEPKVGIHAQNGKTDKQSDTVGEGDDISQVIPSSSPTFADSNIQWQAALHAYLYVATRMEKVDTSYKEIVNLLHRALQWSVDSMDNLHPEDTEQFARDYHHLHKINGKLGKLIHDGMLGFIQAINDEFTRDGLE